MVFFAYLAMLSRVGAVERGAPVNVLDYGADPTGRRDSAPAFERALRAAAAGSEVVFAPRGVYALKHPIEVPRAVALKGVWESVPAHNGLRDPGLPRPTDDGTTLLVECGAGSETGPAAITLHTDSTLKGVCVYYPGQPQAGPPIPYPFAVAMRGKNPAVREVELLNPYDGIDATENERHLIRDVDGQPLRRGILVDDVTDVGRIEDVHFNPWWSMKPGLLDWQMAHGEAFVFGRSDWEYVTNTFALGYNVGYRFIKTAHGACNGNFSGIGADDSFTALQVDQCAAYGILVTNGEFVSFHGPDPTMVRVLPGNTGTLRLTNCAFWGPCDQCAEVEGDGTVGFGDCTFCAWDAKREGRPALDLRGGKVFVRGCDFQAPGAAIRIGAKVRAAAIGDDLGPDGPAKIEDRRTGSAK